MIATHGGAVTGSVVFKDGSTTLGVGALENGKATFVTSALHVGLHPIRAVYGGSSGLLAAMHVNESGDIIFNVDAVAEFRFETTSWSKIGKAKLAKVTLDSPKKS